MDDVQLKHFFDFLEKKDSRKTPPGVLTRYKLLYEPESLTPEDLVIKGDLNLRDTKITSLPQGLKVGGWLNLKNTGITSLPDNLKVGGSLDLDRTKITSLPQGLKVGGYLSLTDTPITSLPDNLKVPWELSLQGTKITRLPKGLVVGGGIFLGEQVTDIPTDIQAKGGIHYHKAPFGEKIKGYTREELKKIYPGVYSFWK